MPRASSIPRSPRRLGGTLASGEAAGHRRRQDGRYVDAFFAYPADPAKQTMKVYGADTGLFANGKYSSVAQSMLQASVQERVDSAAYVAVLRDQVQTTTVTFKDGECRAGLRGASSRRCSSWSSSSS